MSLSAKLQCYRAFKGYTDDMIGHVEQVMGSILKRLIGNTGNRPIPFQLYGNRIGASNPPSVNGAFGWVRLAYVATRIWVQATF
jgi:hypothetical protein